MDLTVFRKLSFHSAHIACMIWYVPYDVDHITESYGFIIALLKILSWSEIHETAVLISSIAKMNGYHLGEYYTCQEGIIVLEKKCTAGLYYYDPCNEDTTENDIQAKCGFGMF